MTRWGRELARARLLGAMTAIAFAGAAVVVACTSFEDEKATAAPEAGAVDDAASVDSGDAGSSDGAQPDGSKPCTCEIGTCGDAGECAPLVVVDGFPNPPNGLFEPTSIATDNGVAFVADRGFGAANGGVWRFTVPTSTKPAAPEKVYVGTSVERVSLGGASAFFIGRSDDAGSDEILAVPRSGTSKVTPSGMREFDVVAAGDNLFATDGMSLLRCSTTLQATLPYFTCSGVSIGTFASMSRLSASGTDVCFTGLFSTAFGVYCGSADGAKMPDIIAGTPPDVRDVLTRGGQVFWSESDGIHVASATPPKPKVTVVPLSDVTRLAVDGADLYYVRKNEIWRCAKNDCAATPSLKTRAPADVRAISLTQQHVYFAYGLGVTPPATAAKIARVPR